MLADYPIDDLTETIPNFHNTVSRFADFKKPLPITSPAELTMPAAR